MILLVLLQMLVSMGNYSKLLLSLEGTASQNIISRSHLRANGILLLKELVQTYHPPNVPEVIAAKTSQFWGQTKR
jgi:hypothetical protein